MPHPLRGRGAAPTLCAFLTHTHTHTHPLHNGTAQLPSVALRETRGYRCVTVVVSPLIALIEDQVAALRANGIAAVGLTGEATAAQAEAAVNGEFSLVYITPEKAESWLGPLKRMQANVGICCFAIDECHCVSQWWVGGWVGARVSTCAHMMMMMATATATATTTMH